MKKPLRLLAAFFALGAVSLVETRASVLLELSGGYLKNSANARVTNGTGLLVLVASTSDSTFTPITSDSIFVAGTAITADSDDIILSVSSITGDGNLNGADDAGEFRQSANVELSSAIPAGSPLRLYWFPTLAATATSAAAGTAYGSYRSEVASDQTDNDDSAAWVLPPDGTTGYELLFLTSDAGSLVNTATSGIPFGVPDSTVAAGDGTAPATPTPTPTTETSTTTTTTTTTTATVESAAFVKRLAALKKKLAKAKRISDPERRKRKIAAIRARIKALVQAYNSTL